MVAGRQPIALKPEKVSKSLSPKHPPPPAPLAQKPLNSQRYVGASENKGYRFLGVLIKRILLFRVLE